MTNPKQSRPKSPEVILGVLENALIRSIAAAKWLTPADEVSIEWAKKLARFLDASSDEQTVLRLGKLFETVTRDLGLSISGRDAKVQEPRSEVSPLDAIRKVAGGKSVTTNQNEVAKSAKPKPRSKRTS
jgi:hypothetical protein